MDYLGSADYLTSPVSGKVEAWTHYNEWGLIVHNAVLKCGQRELDLVKRYATHDYDSVLELYYAKARFYDAHDRHFTAVDPILDPSQYDLREYVNDPVQFVQYVYVKNSPLCYIDILGLSSNNPVDRLQNHDWSSFTSKTKGLDTYYAVADIFDFLYGDKQNDYYDSKTNSSRLTYTYNGKTASLSYSMKDVQREKVFLFMTRAKNESFFKGEYGDGGVPSLLYYNKRAYVSKTSIMAYFKRVWCEESEEKENQIVTLPPAPTLPKENKYIVNLLMNYSSSKLPELEVFGNVLFDEGYEVAFVAGLLANIDAEGKVGLFESSNYDKNPTRKPAYLDYMDKNYNYRQVYSFRNITDFKLSDIHSMLKELEASGWKGKFGLGTVQWTSSRTLTLVELYQEVAGNSDYITYEQATKAEALMVTRELESSSFSKIYTDWKTSHFDIDSPKAAYDAGYDLSMFYERPRGGETSAKKRGEIAMEIYAAMTKE